jgi:predicted phosphodiesterase
MRKLPTVHRGEYVTSCWFYMRIVAVADTHTFQDELGTLPDGDVFIHAGDMLRAGELEVLEPVAAWIAALPRRHKIVVAGNHDRCLERSETSKVACLMLGERLCYLQDSGRSGRRSSRTSRESASAVRR